MAQLWHDLQISVFEMIWDTFLLFFTLFEQFFNDEKLGHLVTIYIGYREIGGKLLSGSLRRFI